MPSVHHWIRIERPAEAVWDAAADVGALHTRLVPGFVVATEMLEDVAHPTRRVTFGDGTIVDEVIVDIDRGRRRLVWSVQGVTHHNGVLTVQADGTGALVNWTADVLPAELAERISPMMALGLSTMKRHLERG
ncbi:SRPBCC family protein [Sphingomonas colocasiae]|uniref:SRPBCC family protein n=1 Tax=Sphingomonas colocasiae TaxID=1848973 RepID=A0ABS7PKR4_9SPHN|nr:SRPBCC family protein [Sphingomonas colocasiae]MBY8821890.1 SRPBCC family protein [Sphingomonas colocasiae]